MSEPVFTTDEVCEQARGNATALILVALAYQRARGLDAADFVRFVGERFAPSWDELHGDGALGAARAAALNLVGGGAELVALSGDRHDARAVFGAWPSPEDLAFFGLTQEDADAFHEVFAPIAARLGLRFTWRREGSRLEFLFARAETG